MKTLFVNPNNRIPLGDRPAVETPLWLLLMAAHYLEDGKDVSILDAEAENLTEVQTLCAALESPADEIIIVAMGNNPSVSSTPKMAVANRILKTLQFAREGVKITGLHPMAVPTEDTLIWRPRQCLALPYHLLPMSKYRAHNWHCLDGRSRYPYASTYTSLGCPFDCYYCNIHTLYDSRKLMYRSIGQIEHEIELLSGTYGVKNIKLWDELFALSEERVVSICKAIEGLDLNIWAYARVDTVTHAMIKAMKRAGVNWLAYGFENASLSVRDQSNKHFDQQQVERAIEMTRAEGINIIGNFTFGLPGETSDTAQDTLAFAMHHLFEFVNFYVALPYPGSQWYKDEKPSLKSYDQYNQPDSLWSAFRDNAFKKYFTNPFYLDMVQRKFGAPGLSVIGEMMGKSIKAGVT